MEEVDIQNLARSAAVWAQQIKQEETRRSVLLKMSAGLSLAAANPALAVAAVEQASVPGDGHRLSGIWESKYLYFSTSRESDSEASHYVVLKKTDDGFVAQSLPNKEGSEVRLRLSVEKSIATGTWTEKTSTEGHYKGAVYHGTLQMLIDPMGRSMTGKWVGFSKDFKVNSGDWSLTLLDESTSKKAQQKYHLKV